jgi:hypothetical protein
MDPGITQNLEIIVINKIVGNGVYKGKEGDKT